MNREIKFRGLCTQSKEMVYGDLIYGVGNKEGKVYILPRTVNLAKVKHCHPLDGVEVIPETVGQYTGLKDMDGKEIYEGDIIKFQKFANWDDETMPRHIAIVHFDQGCFMWKIKKEGKKSDFHYARVNEPLHNTCSTWGLEVIGNIHENPELLKP